MKRLAKLLAVFAFLIILGGVWKSVTKTQALEYPLVPVTGTRWFGAADSPDANIQLRGKQAVNMHKGLVKIGYPAGEPPDQKAPQLCTIFSQPRKPVFSTLYTIGVYGGIAEGTENNPPHMADFASSPGETIYAPNHGYDIGGGLGYLVVYADANSIALHVGNTDGTIDGYAVHFLNLDVNPELVSLYQSRADSRGELPGVGKHQAIGTSRGSSVTVVIRDTGSFMDPRSALDWYSNCNNIDLGEIIPTDGTAGGSGNLSRNVVYPPLGSLQECPVEFPTVGSVNTEKKTPGQTPRPTGFYCGIEPVPEPAACKIIETEGYCALDFDTRRWCFPNTTCHSAPSGDDGNPINNDCSINPSGNARCGQGLEGFCDKLWIEYLEKAHASDQGCDLLNDSDKDIIGKCMGYLGITDKATPTPPPQTEQGQKLPVCVPTANKAQAGRCTSACGDKLTITESLGFNVVNGCATGTCRATVRLDPTTPLYAPLAKNLADYFAGSLDAGAVAEGTISQERLRELQKALTSPPVSDEDYQTLAEGFNRAGVARRLLPLEVQDQLKCQFIKYVKNKIDSGQNTKYKYLLDGTETYFKIGDVPVNKYVLPPYFDQNFGNYDPIDINAGCSVLTTASQSDLEEWRSTPSGIAWEDVPLFDNDEAQGKIEFVSGGLFTSELNPIQTSVPEIRRLNSATNIIQSALMPIETSLPPDERPAAITPQSRFLTIGPEIRPNISFNACTKTETLKELYDAYDLRQAQNAAEGKRSQIYYPESGVPTYTLGVECLQNGGVLPKDPTSLSQVCSVGPQGQINCFQQLPAEELPPSQQKTFPDVAVQTRNVTPYLFDTYLQTIDQSRGVLRIFQPYAVQQAGDNKLDQFKAYEEFEKNFTPLPAESNEIKYLLNSGDGVSLKQEDGWKVLFDKLGGIYTAKEYVLQLLKPAE